MSEVKKVKERKQKASQLTKSKKVTIAKFSEENKSATYAEIGKQFGVTDNQVRRAIEQYNNGELDRKRTREPTAKIKKTMEEMTLTQIIEHQLHYAAAALYNANYLSADEKIVALRNLVTTRNLIAKQELAEHMKGADAEFVCFLYQRYVNPNFTSDQIITIFNEDLDRWKQDKKEG